jgi:hypothetical protein
MYEAYNKCLEKNDNNIDCTIILQNTNNNWKLRKLLFNLL